MVKEFAKFFLVWYNQQMAVPFKEKNYLLGAQEMLQCLI